MKNVQVIAVAVFCCISLLILSTPVLIKAQADLILYNGKIITVDPQDHIYQAIAIKDGKILQLGTDQEIMALAGVHCLMVNLKGKTATPGLIDSHYHLMYYGMQFWPGFLNIRHPVVQCKADLLQVISQYVQALEPDEWISANQGFTLKLDETLDRYDIDGVAPNNPAYLRHSSGQFAVVNSRALQIAGIDRNTPNPPSSLIIRDANGEPTGILSHYPAENLVSQHAPGYGDRTEAQGFEDIELGQKLCLQAGYTSVQDVIVGTVEDIMTYKKYAEMGKLKVRVYAMLYLSTEEQANFFAQNYQPINVGRFVFGGWKLAMDGGMAAKTGLFYDKSMYASQLCYPYHDQETFNRICKTLHNTGLQIAVHVLGDEGIDRTLAGYEVAMKANPRPDPRHRIEHGLFPTPSAIQKMKELGVILSTQPQWLTWYGDGYQTGVTPTVMGQLLPFRSMINAGIHIAFGCDVPASPYQEPAWAFLGAVLRRTTSGTPLSQSEKMTIREALYTHTMGSAYASFSEKVTGSLEVGKYADITVWSHDLYTMTGPEIPNLAAQMTIVNGEILYDSGLLPTKYATGSWKATGQMQYARQNLTATLLPDGRVLIVGWVNQAELYQPDTGTFTVTGATVKNHLQGSTATLLKDGTVLIVGGVNSQKYAEIYHPDTGSFTLIADTLKAPRCYHTATLLPDGRVLIAGGQDNVGPPQTHAKAELYDPATGTFTLTGNLIQHRSGHTATLLGDGSVLLTGGLQTTTPGSGIFLNACEKYDPTSGTFLPVANLQAARTNHAATLLANGRVLITGGAYYQNRNEIYDPATNTWSFTAPMNVVRRSNHTATLLTSGHVLLAGGLIGGAATPSVELYYPETDSYYAVDDMSSKRFNHTATFLQTGAILIAGGYNGQTELKSAELYWFDPATAVAEEKAADQRQIADDFFLSQNYPNPFNADTKLHYRLSSPQQVRIAVYNVRGQWLATLVDHKQDAGEYSTYWDGRTAAGAEVGNGIYLVQMIVGDKISVRKALLLK